MNKEDIYLEIVSDGLGINTNVIDQETGKRIGLIQKIEWEVSTDSPWATAKITIANVPAKLLVHKKTRFYHLIF